MKCTVVAWLWFCKYPQAFSLQPSGTVVAEQQAWTVHAVHGPHSLAHSPIQQPYDAKHFGQTVSWTPDESSASPVSRRGHESNASLGDAGVLGAINLPNDCDEELTASVGSQSRVRLSNVPAKILVCTAVIVWLTVQWLGRRRDLEVERNMFKYFSEETGQQSPASTTPPRGSYGTNGSQDTRDTMFQYLSLASDGGISKIEEIKPLDCSRVAVALMALGFIVFNIYCILSSDLEIVEGYAFYLMYNSTCAFSAKVRTYLSLVERRTLITVEVVMLVAELELMALVFLCTLMMYSLWRFLYWRFLSERATEEQFEAFFSLWQVLDIFKELQSFSLLRAVQIVHPSLVSQQFSEHIAHPFLGEGTHACLVQIAYFVISRAAALFMALVAFGTKMAMVSIYLFAPEDESGSMLQYCYSWCMLGAFFMQALQALPLDRVLRDQLLVISGGADASMDLTEYRLHRTYLALIVRKIHHLYATKGCYMSASVLLLTLSHKDVQYLLVNENAQVKEQGMARFKKH